MQYRNHDSVSLVPGVGPKALEHLDRMGIRVIADLLHWFPRRYIDATNPLPLNLVPFGIQAAVRITVNQHTKHRTKKGLNFLDVMCSDDSDIPLVMRFFNQSYMEKKLAVGSQWTCVGTIERFRGANVLTNPVLLDEPSVIPVYPQTKGVTSWMLQKYIRAVLPTVKVDEVIPQAIKVAEGLPDYAEALRLIHMPASIAESEKARHALAFLETFTFFMRMEQGRQLQVSQAGPVVSAPVDWLKNVVSRLPFELTPGQKRVTWDALQEMQTGKLMTRLLNGDVGSGKTAVAALLAACAAQAGLKTLVLAPTEILAEQHSITFKKLLEVAGCSVARWTASTKEVTDDADIIIGTHAILQEGFTVANVGLVVLDEQHRFGVKQRARLRDAQHHPPHVLSMTATPIPRTLALVLFGDLSVSFLKDKPKNRLPIETSLIPAAARAAMEAKIATEVAAGHQVFVLCPLITDDTVYQEGLTDIKEVKTVLKEAERLRQEHPEFGRVEALHGKMKPKEKTQLMADMQAGKLDVLVATSVIEVGVDVPNATVMVVENAERFGLAQLHQLRGRVGRSTEQGYCFLCPTVGGGPAIERLKVLVEFDSGFDVAERDLELRGPGDITGTVQAGLPDFQLARLTDLPFLTHVKEVVQTYVAAHPEFVAQWQETELSSNVTGLE